MKLIVFGAAGRTGRLIIEQALAGGHEVLAVARKSAAITLQHSGLTVARADVLKASALRNLVAGQEAVISALGVADQKPTTLFSDGIANIISAMQANGVERLLCISAGGLDPGGFFEQLAARLILQRVFRNSYADMARMEDAVKRSSLAWTVMRPARLTNGPRTGRYHTAVNQHLPGGWSISRADVADYMLNHLTDPTTYRGLVEIAY